MDSVTESLGRVIRGAVRTDDADLARVRHDGSHVEGRPVAVVRPRDPDDVVALVRWARDHRVPLVARGAGTSLDGESVPLQGGVVVDFSHWNQVLEIRADEGWARVGPGTVNRDLQNALAPHGVFFPPNPGSWTASTIGGNLGTNASGPRSFRYGPTRVWIRAVDLVLGTGERASWGSLAPKRSVGPDLLSLFVGSEGTLGLATEVTVRLAPRPRIRQGFVVGLPSAVPLGRLAIALSTAGGTGLSAVEYLDRASASELSGTDGFDRTDQGPLLLLEIEADDAAEATARVDRTRGALRASGVTDEPTVYDDADALWTLRGRASIALDRRVGQRIREDVAVPLGQIDRLREEIRRIAEREGVPLYLFAHLGEGSLHPNFVVDPGSPRAERIRAALLTASLDLGGTISGEHGIGSLKSAFLGRELGSPALALLRTIKQACDPDGILNPGKLYPSGPDPVAR